MKVFHRNSLISILLLLDPKKDHVVVVLHSCESSTQKSQANFFCAVTKAI
jgi:hypothetical protein